jgi:hypothetical protein
MRRVLPKLLSNTLKLFDSLAFLRSAIWTPFRTKLRTLQMPVEELAIFQSPSAATIAVAEVLAWRLQAADDALSRRVDSEHQR